MGRSSNCQSEVYSGAHRVMREGPKIANSLLLSAHLQLLPLLCLLCSDTGGCDIMVDTSWEDWQLAIHWLNALAHNCTGWRTMTVAPVSGFLWVSPPAIGSCNWWLTVSSHRIMSPRLSAYITITNHHHQIYACNKEWECALALALSNILKIPHQNSLTWLHTDIRKLYVVKPQVRCRINQKHE